MRFVLICSYHVNVIGNEIGLPKISVSTSHDEIIKKRLIQRHLSVARLLQLHAPWQLFL